MENINLYTPSVYGVGYIGVGEYSAAIKSKTYIVWKGMIRRCYDIKFQELYPTYKGCSVDERWHNFQLFAEWYTNKYKEGFELDKDILLKGNKIYSLETCCFVPPEINILLTKSNRSRGEYPIGVTKNGSKFKAQLRVKGINKHLGYYDTPEEAFKAYKEAKENLIKSIAKEYYILQKIGYITYEALMNYKVEIDD